MSGMHSSFPIKKKKKFFGGMQMNANKKLKKFFGEMQMHENKKI